MPLSAGTRLGPYEIVSAIGAGGMGEVYRARDTRLDRSVAIKVLPAHLSANPDLRARFEREAKTISALQHAHICVLHDVGKEADIDFLVMEYLEGVTLAARLARKPLSVDESLHIAIDLADALDAAHRHGVMHRDLKPGNVMLTKGGAKLMDFGLAKPYGSPARGSLPASSSVTTMTTPDSPITTEGAVVGTVQYMSPEQIQGHEADARSDLFAFGATLYEMLSGKRAFEGKPRHSVASAILENDPAPLHTLQPLTPRSLERVVSRCLAKDPEDRWQNARDLATALRWIAEEGGSGTAEGGQAVSNGRQRELRYGALAFVSLLAAIFGAVSYWRLGRVPARTIVSQSAPPENARFAFNLHTRGSPTLAPDGHAVAFPARDESGKTMLWVHSLDAAAAHPLPGTEGAGDSFWSPDSRAIGFFADGKLKTVDASGGPAVVVAAAPNEAGGSWNRDGTILFVPDEAKGVYQVPASGGNPTLVIGLDASKFGYCGAPRFLPDGRHFFYWAGGSDLDLDGTYLAALDGKEARLLVKAGRGASYALGFLLYVRGGTLMAQAFDPERAQLEGDPHPVAERVAVTTVDGMFDVSQDGLLIYQSDTEATEKQLAWFDRAGESLGVTGEVGDYYDVRLSPDGRKLAFNVCYPAGGSGEVWVEELARSVRMRLTIDPDTDHGVPVWSPEGDTIVFSVLAGKGRQGIYRKPSNGAGGEELLLASEDPIYRMPTSWSHDGRFILFTQGSLPLSQNDIWVLPLAADHKPHPFVTVTARTAAYDGQFSPDGRWVAYTSRESGRDEVYVVPFDASKVLKAGPGEAESGGGKWQISASGGRFPRWRGDGKEMFYLSPTRQIMAAQLEAKGDSVEVGTTQVLFRSAVGTSFAPYDVTSDGKKFVIMTTQREQNTPLTLLVNWTASLNKQ